MGEFLSAGVFTEEVRSGETAILSVSTSNFATVGWLPRGEENKAVLTTSLTDYFRKFGTYWKNSDAPLAITAFFKNGGSRAYVVRVVPADAVAAQVEIPNRWLIKAISRGAWGNLVRAVVRGNQNNYDFATATYSKFDVLIQEETVDGDGDFATVETFEAVELTDEDSASYLPTVLNDEENGSNEVRITAVSGGGVPSAFTPSTITAESVGSGNGVQTVFTHTTAQTPVAPFTLKIKVNGVVVGKDNGRGKLELVTGYTSLSGTVNYETGALSVTFTPAVASSQPITLDYLKAGAAQLEYDLTGGADGTEVLRAQVSDPTLEAGLKGLYALNTVDEMLSIGLPDFRGDATVAADLLAYCDGRQDCFAILDTKPGIDAQDAKNYKQVTLASLSSWGALYYPGVKVADPLKGGKPKVISPVGHVAGVFARTDSTRNVGKAPAGTIDGALNFCLGLERVLSKGERDLIYPAGINPLIDSTATGRAVWGTRTLEVAGDFNLVNVRRLFMFLRKSVFNSTQDLVFEPIGDGLFTVVGLRMASFLGRLTQEGYFASRVPSEAFLVTVDSSNNTPESIAARQLITDILCAPSTPAEFVRFRFQRSLNKLS